jgi:hypothetical protein
MKTLLSLLSPFIITFQVGDLPNPSLTPGSIATSDMNEVCAMGYSRSHRPDETASHKLKLQALVRYGLPRSAIASYEADALVPLCLGGNHWDIRNVWPQSWSSAKMKDLKEAIACRKVCASRDQQLLIKYQQQFIQDWRKVE